MEHNSTWSKCIFDVRVLTLSLMMTSLTLAVAQSNPSEASVGHKVCSNRTIFGNYGFQIEGTILGPNLPLRTLSLEHFNGVGSLTTMDHVVVDGNPPEEEWRPGTGTYSVNADCTGSASIDVAPGNPPLNFHFLVVDSGRQILLVVDGGAIRGVGHRID
jgi:hypothetical protein